MRGFSRWKGALRDLAPIFAVIVFFQIVVVQQPFLDVANVVAGLVCVVLGLEVLLYTLRDVTPWG